MLILDQHQHNTSLHRPTTTTMLRAYPPAPKLSLHSTILFRLGRYYGLLYPSSVSSNLQLVLGPSSESYDLFQQRLAVVMHTPKASGRIILNFAADQPSNVLP